MADGAPRLRGYDYSRQRSYLVTYRVCNGRRVFANPSAAQIACDTILHYRSLGWYAIYAYCVMPDHIHLVLKLLKPTRSITLIVGTIKAVILHRCRRAGFRFAWQRGFHDHVIRDYEPSDDSIKYVMENPVRAQMVKDFRAYPFSDLVDPWR